jgi:demethylspheroidene O-methyltransferase
MFGQPNALLARMPVTGWLLAWRERLIGNETFQRWAANFPLTRRVARRHAQRAFDLCAGFVYSQVLAASLRAGILEALAKSAKSEAALSAVSGLSLDRLTLLLAAAESLDLVERRGNQRWGLGPVGAALSANAGALAMVRHHDLFYADLSNPLALLRGEVDKTHLTEYWSYARNGAAMEVQGYSELMARSQPMIAREILRAWDFRRHAVVLDVGGGEGAFLQHVAVAAPNAQLQLFDLPEVVSRASRTLDAAGLGARVTVHGGSFLTDELPRGADLITLVRVAHDHDDVAVMALFERIRAALPTGGRLLLAEPMSGAEGAGRMADAYLAFYLLAMGQGRPRTPARLGEMLLSAGFRTVRPVATRMPMLTSIVMAEA